MQMISDVLVFPGQGSQKVGMGKDLYDNFAVAKDVFLRVDRALNFSLSSLMFEGSIEELSKTSAAQPAIMTVSMAYFAVLKEKGLINPDNIKFMAGHSLGEYSALCAAGALSLEDTAALLQQRGQAMMQACLENSGTMAALIGFDYEQVKQIADAKGCFIGNSNSPVQIVISGSTAAVNEACNEAQNLGIKHVIPLAVSGAFHSPLMQSAADMMEEVLSDTKIVMPHTKVVSNLTAKEYANSAEIKKMLVQQITHPVKWQESINYMIENGAGRFIEIGFGSVLTGLIKKIAPEAATLTSQDMLSIA